MNTGEAKLVITGALRLALERATGTPEEKKIRRERLADLIDRMTLEREAEPAPEDIADALGGPDDATVREAIRVWGSGGG